MGLGMNVEKIDYDELKAGFSKLRKAESPSKAAACGKAALALGGLLGTGGAF